MTDDSHDLPQGDDDILLDPWDAQAVNANASICSADTLAANRRRADEQAVASAAGLWSDSDVVTRLRPDSLTANEQADFLPDPANSWWNQRFDTSVPAPGVNASPGLLKALGLGR